MTEVRQDLVTVILVDDHGILREGTRGVLERDPMIRVLAETGDRDEAIKLGMELKPSVMLIDVQLNAANGIDVVRSLSERGCPSRCLILSAYDDSVYVTEALSAGAFGYLLKSTGSAELISAIHAAASGVAVIDDRVSRRLLMRSDQNAVSEHLTPRETEVLRLLARGRSNKQIAHDMGLGLRTVESHVSNVLGKCAVRSRAEAILYAVSHGLVSAPNLGGNGD